MEQLGESDEDTALLLREGLDKSILDWSACALGLADVRTQSATNQVLVYFHRGRAMDGLRKL